MIAKFAKMESQSPSRAAHEQEPRHRPCCKICLLCLVTSVFVAIVAGLSIHVLQIRQSLLASDQKYLRLWEQHQEMNRTQCQCPVQIHEPNSTLESMTSENSGLDLSQSTCLKNVSVPSNNVSILEHTLFILERNISILENKLFVLESNLSVMSTDLSDQHQMQTDLRHNFSHLELKCRTLNETKAKICQLLSSRKEKTCSKDWIGIESLCYFISTFESSYEGAKKLCSIAESKLLEINTNEEEKFVSNAVLGEDSSYWIGTCKAGKVASNVVYKVTSGKFECSECKSSWLGSCTNDQHRFICEKPASLFPDIPEKIRVLCRNAMEGT
ncbi:B-cell differentiation antigen CD72-like [Hypanus sabinus]|uniref:B-cell differentiation antigen CD72-like n=1 Tax=Hypanus sabinus TaxID=79690 RepID=UPI0028C47CAF|nr:B-cell differentiation antigen CD72-like [Hypanus sabinus]